MTQTIAAQNTSERQAVVPELALRDLVQAGRWQTAFFTSYSLSLSYFEAVVLHALRQAGVRASSIAVDLDGYRSSLSERGVSEAGRSYDVVPISMPKGIFHPKLMVLEGETGLRATVGSGNLTFRGWGGNLEVVEYLNAETEPVAFADLADFLERLSSSARAARRLACERDPIPVGLADRCRAAARGPRKGGDLRVLHSMERPIAEQVAEFADELGRVSSFRVVSPFLSVDAVYDLAALLGCAVVSLCVPKRSPEQFDFAAARKAGLTATPVTADDFLDPDRPLHAKILEIACERGRLTLAGSVNATQAALLTTDNVELAVLRVTDRPSLIGWRPCDEPEAMKAPPPVGDQTPCLVARHDGARVIGRLLGVGQPEGTWRAAIGPNDSGTDTEVEPDGRFAFPSRLDPLRSGRAPQLVLSRGTASAAGWVMLDQDLAAVRERGRTAEAMMRVLAGGGNIDDIAAILAFFAENPGAMAPGPAAATSSERTKSPHTGASGPIDIGNTVPAEAPITGSGPHPGGSGASAFDRLLANLRRRFDVNEDTSTTTLGWQHATKRAEGEPEVQPPSLLPNHHADKALAALFGRAEHNRAAGRELMGCILGFIRFMSGHVKEPEEFVESGIRRWLETVRTVPKAVGMGAPDDLDKMFAAVVTARALEHRFHPMTAHELLQAWRGGLVVPDWADEVKPDGAKPLEAWLVPGIAEQAWADAWQSILATETRWAWARTLADALASGAAPSGLPKFLTEDEARAIRRAFVAPMDRRDRIVRLIDHTLRNQTCPRHFITLTTAQDHRFRSERVASTQCCDLVLLNLDIHDERSTAT